MQISEDVRLSALVDSILRDLHSFPHPTQLHSIIVYFMYTYDTVQDFLVRNDTLIWLFTGCCSLQSMIRLYDF